MLYSQQLGEMVMTFRPIRILFQRTPLLLDLRRGFVVKHGIGHAPEEIISHGNNVAGRTGGSECLTAQNDWSGGIEQRVAYRNALFLRASDPVERGGLVLTYARATKKQHTV